MSNISPGYSRANFAWVYSDLEDLTDRDSRRMGAGGYEVSAF